MLQTFIEALKAFKSFENLCLIQNIYLMILNSLSYLICRGKFQNFEIEKSVSTENQINQTFPIIFTLGTKPTPLRTLLSDELSLLSPIKKNLSLGIWYSGV